MKDSSLGIAADNSTQAFSHAPAHERGAIFTRAGVVHFMLDIVGYTSEVDLVQTCILEPSCGTGNFLIAMIGRLLEAYRHFYPDDIDPVSTLKDSIRAVEVHQATFVALRHKVIEMLTDSKLTPTQAQELADFWLIQADFLLCDLPLRFSHVVGNPPYLRLEVIPKALLEAYRQRYATFRQRADLYIPFFERGLQLLAEEGRLCFICSDRWLKNRYGAKLRQYIADDFQLEHYINLQQSHAFQENVIAYPAITTISKKSPQSRGKTTAVISEAALENLPSLASALQNQKKHKDIHKVREAVQGNAPWLLDSLPQLALIRYVERHFVPLERAGCKVGIGVASGLDSVYIDDVVNLNVEASRILPLAMTQDISATGQLQWRGKGIINPFDADGVLVQLEHYPKLRAFFEKNRPKISQRHVAKRKPQQWYRTIDKISVALTHTPKLLIPDIKNKAVIAYDSGTVYPHHNLYYIISEQWDLRALRTILRSDMAKLFVWAYSVKMRGGWLRFQAQNLRRICVPPWESLSGDEVEGLLELHHSDDMAAINAYVFALYQLEPSHLAALKLLPS